MRSIFIFFFCLLAFSSNAMEKKTTFNKELFDKAKSEGKVVIVSSWIKYCSSCASQMKVLQRAKNEGGLSDIKFNKALNQIEGATVKSINGNSFQKHSSLCLKKTSFQNVFEKRFPRRFLKTFLNKHLKKGC